MLTDSEREWIIANKHLNGCIYVRHCRYTCFEPPYCPVIPTKEDLIDAALFEARVAAKLAKGIPQSAWLAEAEKCDMPPSWTRLKLARLAVEEEENG